MKRSEVLSVIANQLDFLNGKFQGVRTDFSFQELARADVILSSLEHMGMRPPSKLIVIKPTNREDIVRAESQYFVNEWEKE